MSTEARYRDCLAQYWIMSFQHEEEIAVSEIVDSAVAMVRQKADEKGLSLEYRLTDGASTLLLDARKTRQILVNIFFPTRSSSRMPAV